MNRKGAIELSANFIVVIVISIVILVGGIALFYKIYHVADDNKDAISAQIEEDIKSMMLQSGARVAVYPRELTLDIGGSDAIGLGITNIYGEQKIFTMIVDVTYFADSETPGRHIEGEESLKFYSTKPGALNAVIAPGDQKVSTIILNIPKGSSKGQYIYTIAVTENDNADVVYDNVQVYVNAK